MSDLAICTNRISDGYERGNRPITIRPYHLSHVNTGEESVPITLSIIGSAISSPFSLFANITTPDFDRGSAITKALNTPLSPQCHRKLFPSLRSIPHPNPQKRFFDSSFGSCLMQILHSGSRATCGVSILSRVDRFSPFHLRLRRRITRSLWLLCSAMKPLRLRLASIIRLAYRRRHGL